MRTMTTRALLICLFLLAFQAPAFSGVIVPVGGVSESDCPNLALNNHESTSATLKITGTNAVATGQINVDVTISDPFSTSLVLYLTSPSGTEVLLTAFGHTGGAVNFPGTVFADLSDFIDEPMDGTWTLRIEDPFGVASGTLDCWGINDSWAQTYYDGDVNGDGGVDINDWFLLRAALGTRIGDPGYMPAGDVNDDGRIWFNDLTRILTIIRSNLYPPPPDQRN